MSDMHLRAALRAGSFSAATFEVHSLKAVERVSDLTELTLDVTTERPESVLDALLGQPARLLLGAGEKRRVFYGIVTRAEALGRRNTATTARYAYRLTLAPRAWLLTQCRTSRVFQDMDVTSVIRAIFNSYGIPTRWLVRSEYPSRPYTTQHEETDWECVTRLAAENGLFFYFENPFADNDDLFAVQQVADLVAKGVSAVASAVGAGPLGAALPQAGHVLGAAGPARSIIVFGDSSACYPQVDAGAGASWSEVLSGMASIAAQFGDAAGATPGQAGQVASQVLDTLGAAAAIATGAAGAPLLEFRQEAGALQSGHDNRVLSFTRTHAVRALSASHQLFDPSRPHAPLRSTAHAQDQGLDALRNGLFRAIPDLAEVAGQTSAAATAYAERAEGGVTTATALVDALVSKDRIAERHVERPLEVYDHHGRHLHPNWAYDGAEAQRMLKRARRRAEVAQGHSVYPWLAAGHRFRLADHPLDELNGEYVVVSVTHEWRTADAAVAGGRVYDNHFECVPARVCYLPAAPRRRVVQTCQTATVVGQGDEISVDSSARIRVRFHWERQDHDTCWIRVMQPWAGSGWGAQFIPRVGNEVVVGFDGGDPDKPIVLGSVYNGAAPPPFQLPEERTKSGFRTCSTPGNDSSRGNELHFDDADGRERVYLHAQKDLDVSVNHDRVVTVRNDDRHVVSGRRHARVNGNASEDLQGDREVTIARSDHISVEGNRTVVAGGNQQHHVRGDDAWTVDGQDHRDSRGDRLRSVKGNTVHRHAGNLTQLVGSADARKAWSTQVEGHVQVTSSQTMELVAEHSLELRCGKSVIRLSPDHVEISGPQVMIASEGARARWTRQDLLMKADGQLQGVAQRILWKGESSSLMLSQNAALGGARVQLNSGSSATDDISDRELKPTVIELKDQQGNPIPSQRFRIVLEDGSERSGMVDDNGRAELFLEHSGRVYFPGLKPAR